MGLTLSNLAGVRAARGDPGEAEGLYRRALETRERCLGPSHPAVGLTLHNFAQLLSELGRRGEAEALHRRALAVLEAALDPSHPTLAACREGLLDPGGEGDRGKGPPV